MTDLRILHKDHHLLVVNKPGGLLTVPGRLPENKDSILTRLLKDYPNSQIVHRLDMPTSGLLLVPQSKAALSHLARQFQSRTIGKRYLAVVTGLLNPNEGEVDVPLICDWPNRPRQMVAANGKPSLTHYRVLARDEAQQCTLVRLMPVTGRSHQLRVHMTHIGHPIVGDTLYGAPLTLPAARLYLHAEQISFTHPVTGCEMNFTHEGFSWPLNRNDLTKSQ
ncbi:RluA family pseudouridine synthase [Halioxenophilus sp. WMMB6]|uniref:RluA family pseudouridine synthase n=1 Tax=Halioxenophilus sp. WMMB6 TaxID=3073815 RepID=UPI00295E29D4|nr:RluA family pseudouridine synthase [Halioxenophilus sp. WMMB6]